MSKVLFLNQNSSGIAMVFADRRERVAKLWPTYPEILRKEDLPAHKDSLKSVEVIFSTWGMPALDAESLSFLPKLRAVFYAAGSVKGFAQALLERDIQVCSAWRANALPVAESTLSYILLSLKQTFQHARSVRTLRAFNDRAAPITGAYGSTVGIIGLGAIGRRVVELLAPFDLKILAFDPYAAPTPGIELVSLEDLFSRSDVVSLHAPWIPQTEGMITGDLLRRLRPWTTFINTARGKIIREDELITVLTERSDLQAILDVTWPEPPVKTSPLYDLPNVFMTPHIAGAKGNEMQRMADWVIADCERFLRGESMENAVTLSMLATMA